MSYYVYVLRSTASGRHYTGITKDVARRLQEHDRGKDPSIRGRGPFEIVLVETFETRREAGARERQIKSYKGGEAFRRLIAVNASPSSNG